MSRSGLRTKKITLKNKVCYMCVILVFIDDKFIYLGSFLMIMGRWIKDKDGVLTYNPYSLKFYETEMLKHRVAHGKKLSMAESKIVFKKLCRHYRVDGTIEFNSRMKGGLCCRWVILVGTETTFGILCHEVAHMIDKIKRTDSKHDKKLVRIVDRINKYCQKKEYWEKELTRRTKIKIKVAPS